MSLATCAARLPGALGSSSLLLGLARFAAQPPIHCAGKMHFAGVLVWSPPSQQDRTGLALWQCAPSLHSPRTPPARGKDILGRRAPGLGLWRLHRRQDRGML